MTLRILSDANASRFLLSNTFLSHSNTFLYRSMSTLNNSQLYSPNNFSSVFTGCSFLPQSISEKNHDSSIFINSIEIKNRSVVATPFYFVFWKPKTMGELTLDSFALTQIISPKPEIVVIGTGQQRLELLPEHRNFFKKNDVLLEVLDSENAMKTFNFLCEEGRNAYAFILKL